MKTEDWKLIAYIGLILGIVFLVGAFITAQPHWASGIGTYYPYKDYAPPLAIAGIALLVIGMSFMWRAAQE